MKVNAVADAIQSLNQIKTRREGDGGAAQNTYERMSDQRDGQQKHARDQAAPTAVPAHTSDEVVHQVLIQFNTDSQITSSGIHAEIEGRGADLAVILRDHDGHALRRMSGAEFVRMCDETRETKGAGLMPMGLRRGKLFDQKA